MTASEWMARQRGRSASPSGGPSLCGDPACVGGEERVGIQPPNPDAVTGRLFGARIINGGEGMIRLDLPPAVSRGAEVTVSIQVSWPLILSNAVACLYLLAMDRPEPLLARVPLIPDVIPPCLSIRIRLEETTEVRAVVECGDGTLLQAIRRVRVLAPEGGTAAPGRERP